MNRLALFATVASLALTGAAFAQTNSSTTTPTTPPKPAASATAPAPSPTPPSKAQTTKPSSAPTNSMAAQPENKSAIPPAKSAETAKPAAPKTAMEKKAELRPMRTAHRERARKHTAMHLTMAASRLADRETKALNVLEAKGYGGNYENFQRDGRDYSAMVMKNGKPEKVMVNPDAGTVTPMR